MIRETISAIAIVLMSVSFAAADAKVDWGHIKSQKGFNKLDETGIPGTHEHIVAYSLSNKGQTSYYIALFRTTPQGPELLSKSDVTVWLGSEKPLKVKMALNYFKHLKKFDIVHLNLWRSLSDSAIVSNVSSDLFYVIDPDDFSLIQFWELEGSNSYYSDKQGHVKRKTTEIYVTDNWIYILTYGSGKGIIKEDLRTSFEYRAFDIYDKNSKSFRGRSSGSEPGGRGSLPEGARRLRQVNEPILEADFYQNLFYPKGMPTETDTFWEEEGQTSFQFIKSIKVPKTDIEVVLYSKNLFVPEHQYGDFAHIVHLAVLRHPKNGLQIVNDMDVTDYITYNDYSDWERERGFCVQLHGNLETYKLSGKQQLLFLSLGKVESGSGGIWDTSNILYLIDNKDYILSPVFISSHDSGGGRAGLCCDGYYQTFIYLADVDSDGINEILTQDYKYEIDRGKHERTNFLDPKVSLYKYDNNEKKYKLSGQIEKVPPGAVKLDRVFAVGVHESSEDDWEN